MTFPFFQVPSYEIGLPISVVVWHVRSVRPIREMANDNETITRIEFGNGDVLDTSDTVRRVLEEMCAALSPITDCLSWVGRFPFERMD